MGTEHTKHVRSAGIEVQPAQNQLDHSPAPNGMLLVRGAGHKGSGILDIPSPCEVCHM